MKMRTFIAFAVLGLSIASAKNYQITLDSATKAGTLTLKAGKYNVVAMDASKVRFTEVGSGKTVETEAKIENGEKKYGDTAVNASQVDGTKQINEIMLGGTTTKIRFE